MSFCAPGRQAAEIVNPDFDTIFTNFIIDFDTIIDD